MAGNFANVKIAVNFVFYEINQDLMSSFTSCHYRGSPGPGPIIHHYLTSRNKHMHKYACYTS